MEILGYYWKGFGHAWSDLLYNTTGLWTYGRVMDEMTNAIHPDFGWAIREAYDNIDTLLAESNARGYEGGRDDGFARGYEAAVADREIKVASDGDPYKDEFTAGCHLGLFGHDNR